MLTWRLASILFADEQQTELFEVQPWFEDVARSHRQRFVVRLYGLVGTRDIRLMIFCIINDKNNMKIDGCQWDRVTIDVIMS